MATPPSSLDKWRDDLRDINFRLDGYRRTDAFRQLGDKMYENVYVHWNMGVGPAASFTRAISGFALEEISQRWGHFDHVIKVELKEPTPTEEAASNISIEMQLAAAVAEKLGLLDQEYSRLKEADDERRYYTYGMEGGLEGYVRRAIVPRINEILLKKRYLLVVENLYKPISSTSFSVVVGLPPHSWTSSEWVISTTSSTSFSDVYASFTNDDGIYASFTNDGTLMIILSALHQSAQYILNSIHQGDKQYWHHVALRCFHYAMLLFPQCSPRHGGGDHQSSSAPSVTSDELIHQWLAQGILISKPKLQEPGSSSSKYHNVHKVGRVILEAFQEYSLMQLPFSPAREADEATKSAAHFLLYHDLIAEGLIAHELSEDKELEHKKWISFVSGQGWHVSKEWLRQEETSGPTAFILRGYSQHSKLESCLPKLCFLCVLDLSYTSVNSLPSSIGCLLNLRLLSLRGCHDLKTLFSSSTAITTDSTTSSGSYSPLSTLYQLQILDMNGVPFSHLTQDIGNQKSNLIHLDMSYSELTTFPLNFFQGMSSLEVLILVKCPNLVELPPSMAALLSLTTLVISGSQLKSFPENMFEEMHKLQALKLINNKKLISLPGSISRAHGLIELHIEGWEVKEIKLVGHPTLKSFSLISAPHMRCLSLRGCKNLESVDLRDLGALEDLDLSATAIRELPADIPNLPQLRRLFLMGVPSLRRFPWHKLQRLPDVFCLDQCADGTGNHSNQVSQVCISDSKLFHSFNHTARDLVRDGRFFQLFYVRVAPCMVKIRKMQDGDDMVANKLQELVQKKSPYSDVYCHYMAEGVNSMASMVTPAIRQTERHVEISAMDRYPHGLTNLLEVTKSIAMTEDTFVYRLNDLSNLHSLEECKLRWCHRMGHVFDRNLTTLKHLHLEYCPRLMDIMPSGSALPSLTTLDILFCYNLKTIFWNYGQQGYSYQLPCLQRIRLQESPQLKHLCNDDAVITAPMWKELHVRGCWSLHRLPHLLQVKEEASKVEVSGERAWWAKLRWDEPQHGDSYKPKLSPTFASFDERAEVKSYLR